MCCLFQDGKLSQERILVLFYFCTDLCICAVRRRLGRNILADLTAWTLRFLRDTVVSWVHEQGGWQRVLQDGLDLVQQVAFVAACAAVVTACIFYIRNRH